MTEATPTPHACASELGHRLFGQTPLVSRFQSAHTDMFRLDFARGTPAHLIKLVRSDPAPILREQQVLRELHRREFEVPPIEFTQADCPEISYPFTVLPMIGGMSAAAIYTQDSRRGVAIFEQLGQFLGRLAALPLEAVPGGMSDTEARACELNSLDALHTVFSASKWFRKEHQAHFQNARRLLEGPPTWFGHREGGQLITDGNHVFVVIDWGESGAVWPYADLARHIYATRTRHELWGGQWLASLLRGFGAHRPLENGWIEIVEAWLLYYCLRDAAASVKTERSYSIPRLLGYIGNTLDHQWLQGT